LPRSAASTLAALTKEIQTCGVCAAHLPLGPRPVVRLGRGLAPILLIGQAPGTKVHASGTPWDDASGKRLRDWLGVDSADFYDEDKFAIMPMGFCYPGRQGGGDAPPRPECAPLWHDRVLTHLRQRKLTILIGAYAQARYLGAARKPSLSATVADWRRHADRGFLPLVHPSPRNVGWLKTNPWFEADVVPGLRAAVAALLRAPCRD
jgi:uracil-DNA glycosylase